MNFTYREMPEEYRQNLIQELKYQYDAPDKRKDIVIVVRNQYRHLNACLESIRENTKNYRLFIWDNASSRPVNSLIRYYDPYVLATCDANWGFILPNNYMAAMTTSPYLILLNSDVVVSPGWSEAMIGYLSANNGVVGYQGGLLDENCCGVRQGWGEEIDYVSGWCMCIPREIYKKIGLFDTELQFAYGEDSDYCLRVKKMGYKVYALHLAYAKHAGSVTIEEVKKEKDVVSTFKYNHSYLKSKWGEYLKNNRVLAKENATVREQYGKA